MNTTDMPITRATSTMSDFISQVYAWMAGALAISAAVAYAVASSPTAATFINDNGFVLILLLLADLGLVIFLTARIQKMSVTTAMTSFVIYAALNGLTFSFLFLTYTAASLFGTFLVTAGTFAVMAIYGYTTKRDLSGMGSFLLMGLFGIIIASVVNIFLLSDTVGLVISYAAVLIFVGLIAYDMQKIKNMAAMTGDMASKYAVLGALMLYLDFVNLFVNLLRIFGKKK